MIVQTGPDVHAYALESISPSSSTVHVEQKKVQLNKKRRDEVGFFAIGKAAHKPTLVMQQRYRSGFKQLRLSPSMSLSPQASGLRQLMSTKIQCGDALFTEGPPFFTDKGTPSNLSFYRNDLAVIHDGGIDLVDPEVANAPISLPDFALTSGMGTKDL